MPIRRTIFRYASAAIVLSFVTLSIFKFTGTQPSAVKTIASTVAVALNPSILQGKNMNDKQFNDAMNNLSEDDIASYLEKNGNESDIAELESNIDDNNLPSQDDYLLDDKTLENYLSDNVKQADN